MKLTEKTEAVRLRKLGRSYKEIRKKLSISKGTLSLWLRDIGLTEKQKERLYVELRQKNAYRLAKFNQTKKKERSKLIIAQAEKESVVLFRNPLFLSGLMLYWAEGDKSEDREAVKFSNSDPLIIKLMMRWFREICNIPEKKFRIALHIHELFCRKDVEKYWSKLTDIPFTQFHKTQIKPTSLRFRRNRLYNGTCAIVINSKDLFRKIKGWKIGAIAKFDIII